MTPLEVKEIGERREELCPAVYQMAKAQIKILLCWFTTKGAGHKI